MRHVIVGVLYPLLLLFVERYWLIMPESIGAYLMKCDSLAVVVCMKS